jgi:adenylate kinase family enzyme
MPTGEKTISPASRAKCAPPPELLPPRLLVLGTCGSGKTSLARRLAERLHRPHHELDSLTWGPNWTLRPREQVREEAALLAREEAWIVDGNYSDLRDIWWPRAQAAVWLDYSLPVVLCRLLTRTARRIIRREELWSGNRESVRLALSRDSIILWALRTYRRRRRQIPARVSEEYPHIALYRLATPAEAESWLSAGKW